MIYIILIGLLATVWIMPWWGAALWTFVYGWLQEKRTKALWQSTLVASLAWGVLALLADSRSEGLISLRMTEMLGLTSWQLFLVTGAVGGIVGLSGALLAVALRPFPKPERPGLIMDPIRPALALGLLPLLMGASPAAQAAAIETNLFYLSDNLEAADKATGSKMFVDGAILINLTRRGRTMIGWNVGMINTADTGDTERSFSLQEMGPKLSFHMGREKEWGLAFVYNLNATAKYKAGADEAEWRGTSYKVEFGYNPQLTERLFGGLRLNYYTASFNEQLVGSTNYSTISNSRALIYPSFHLSFRWD